MLEGFKFSLNVWQSFTSSDIKNKLNKYVCSVDNPKGILDFEIRVGHNQVVKEPFELSKFQDYKGKSREVLLSYERKELERICDLFNITHINRADKFLINKIIERQEELSKAIAEKAEE